MFDMVDVLALDQYSPEYEQNVLRVRKRHSELTKEQQSLRAREIARLVGVSEAQWVSASCGPIKSIRLSVTPQTLFKELRLLGPVMALTRNDSCVHERHGEYLDVQTEGPVGLVLGPAIDLRIFFGCWTDVFAVQEVGRLSLQFFDTAGVAVHKVYCTDQTDVTSYLTLVQRYADVPVWPQSTAVQKNTLPDIVTNLELFRQSWLAMKDTHDFFGMLNKFNVSRMGALRQAGTDLAQPVSQTSIEKMLRQTALGQIKIMCFVGNRGMIQIHTGQINHVMMRGEWLNVLDPTFNLHLNITAIKQVWVVNKPTIDGWVTSLEVYDAQDELIVQFFGARKPGKPELKAWRNLMLSFCTEPLRN